MKINSIKFVGSVAKLKQLPKIRLPEIAFSGRSNVGKSSLINSLLNRKKLAKTSSTPGKTRLLNYFEINESFYMVDLPGYGYAKVSHNERLAWKRLLESYLSKNDYIRGVVQIIDSRHGITKLDEDMLNWLSFLEIPTLVVATKVDKLPKSRAKHLVQRIEKDVQLLGGTSVLPYSSMTKIGKAELWQSIDDLLNNERQFSR